MTAKMKLQRESARKLREAQHEIRDVAQALIRIGYGIDPEGVVTKLYLIQASLLAISAALDPNPYLIDENVENGSVPWG